MAVKFFTKIAVIGGGTGIFSVLQGLKTKPCRVSAIVSMADDGGSTGRLRDDYGVLPPGDIRQALVALSLSEKIWRDLFIYRYPNGELKGHSFGNLFLSALEKMTGDFSKAVEYASRILESRGNVVPVTLSRARLLAELENGRVVRGESNIGKASRIKKVFFDSEPKINKMALEALDEADLIVVGPGSLFTSILPNLIVPGFSRALAGAKARKIFVANIMTQPGETKNFTLADFLRVFEETLGASIFDLVLYNNQRPSIDRLKKYAETRAVFLEKGDLKPNAPPIIELPLITNKGFIRHNPAKISAALLNLSPA